MFDSLCTIVSAVYLYLFVIFLLGLCIWIFDNLIKKRYGILFFVALYIVFAFSYRIVAGITSKRYAIFLIVPGIYGSAYCIKRLSSHDFWNRFPKNKITGFFNKYRAVIGCLIYCFLLCSFLVKDLIINRHSNAVTQIGETTQADAKRGNTENYISNWTDYFPRYRFYCNAYKKPIQLQPEWDATDSDNLAMLHDLKTCNFPFYIIRKKSVKESKVEDDLPIVRLFEAYDSNRKNKVLQCWRYEKPVQYDIIPDQSENLFSNADFSKTYLLKQRYPNVVSQMVMRGQSFFENDDISIPDNIIIGGVFDVDSVFVEANCSEKGFGFSSSSFFSWYSQQKFTPGSYYYSVRLQAEEDSFFRLGISTLSPNGIKYKQLGMFFAPKDTSERVFTVLIEPADAFSTDFQLFFLMAEGRVNIKKIYLINATNKE